MSSAGGVVRAAVSADELTAVVKEMSLLLVRVMTWKVKDLISSN